MSKNVVNTMGYKGRGGEPAQNLDKRAFFDTKAHLTFFAQAFDLKTSSDG